MHTQYCPAFLLGRKFLLLRFLIALLYSTRAVKRFS
jgi:hypothetical protein